MMRGGCGGGGFGGVTHHSDKGTQCFNVKKKNEINNGAGRRELASGPLLTLTIIVINSDTQSSLFTGSSRRERRDKLVYWRGPFSQGAVVHHLV